MRTPVYPKQTKPPLVSRQTYVKAAIFWACLTLFVLGLAGLEKIVNSGFAPNVLIAQTIDIAIATVLNAILYGWLTAAGIGFFWRITRAR
jgi:hypothetical protein